jgi:predicted ATP-grasp superfamily ATP-dependent carboligase
VLPSILEAQPLRIIIYEQVSGGGYAQRLIPPSVLSEGFAMLRSVVSDLKDAGHEVTIFLDQRLSKLNPPINADCTIPILGSVEPEQFLNIVARINDAIYIIAPETGQTLQQLVTAAEQTGKISLNCESNAIAQAADKTILYQSLQKLEVAPKTKILNIDISLAEAKRRIKEEFDYPLILKPADGVGCSGLSLLKEDAQIEKAITKIRAESPTKEFIVQQYVNGEPASVSLLSTGKKAVALSLNEQNVTLAEPNAISSYDGGTVPFEHPLREEAFSIAEKVVDSISGLRGYVGVDLILSQDKPFVVDVNPRLTTSYVGLGKVAGFNVGEALVNAVLKGKLPEKHENQGYVCFSKIETSKPTMTAFDKVANLDFVVSPPFPLNGNPETCSLLLSTGTSLQEATARLKQAKKRLFKIIT